MASPKSRKPRDLITYLCTRCAWDFARTERDPARCTLCGKGDRITELHREPVTPQALEAAMMRSVERLMGSLQKAYDAGKEEGMDDEQELQLLKALAKSKNLKEGVKKAFVIKKSRRRPRVHAMKITL